MYNRNLMLQAGIEEIGTRILKKNYNIVSFFYHLIKPRDKKM